MGKTDETWEAGSSPATVDDLTDALLSLQLKKDQPTSSEESNQESFDAASKDLSFESEAEVNTTSKPSTSIEEPSAEKPLQSPDKETNVAEKGNSVAIKHELSTPSSGEESDEDNENVVLEDSPPSKTGAVQKMPSAPKSEEEEYQERGPCKVSRSHYSGSRYNPMSDLNGKGDSSLLSFCCDDTTIYQPVTPPYCQGLSLQDELRYDASPPQLTTDMVVPDMLNLTPGHDPALYNSPLYAGYSSPAANDMGDYSPAPATVPSYGYGSGGNSEMQAANYGGWDGNYITDNSCSPFGPDLSTNFLDAIEDAVARTVDSSGELTSSGSEDGDDLSDQNIRLIMDSLRSIDPNELDYIAPASPAAAHLDLEQELALSEQWPESCSALLTPSPPLTPSSPSLPATPHSPGDSPPSSPPHCRDSRSVKDLVSSCRAAVAAVRELCNPDVILRAAKRVACQDPNDLCHKDRDGDTCYMIVVCKPSDSEHFYENMFVLQQHLQKLRLCCDQVLDADAHACPLCGASRAEWRTLLSETNSAGDTVLSCAVKMRHPELVIDYLCAGLANCQEDLRRVFDPAGRKFFKPYARIYPGLKRFL